MYDYTVRNFNDYFTSDVDYPSQLFDEILPWGERLNYVSSSFLNGLVNYCTPIRAYLINKYQDWNDVDDEDDGKTKYEIFKDFKRKPPAHTWLGCFNDDVAVLATIENIGYIFFWFDQDVSDCVIGRFKTDDSDQRVCDAFNNYILQSDGISGPVAREIPVSAFRGWISF